MFFQVKNVLELLNDIDISKKKLKLLVKLATLPVVVIDNIRLVPAKYPISLDDNENLQYLWDQQIQFFCQ